MKKNYWRLAAAVAGLVAAGVVTYRSSIGWPVETAMAIGDLTIDWGVPAGNPIFTETNFAPGETETHAVAVTNNAPVTRQVAVRGLKTAGNGLSGQLVLVIADGSSDLYGGSSGTGTKTLADFFTDGAAPSGIPLLPLAPGANVTLTFSVTFNPTAGNSVQQDSVVFNIKLGIGFDLPAQCEVISFSGQPIFGTAAGDDVRGTAGNDLIVTFEGSDNVRGNGGDDCIVGGGGADNLRGDNGHDVLVGGDGADNLNGGAGPDTLLGGAAGDNLRGEDGNDVLQGEAGPDLANGGRGVDACEAELEQTCEL